MLKMRVGMVCLMATVTLMCGTAMEAQMGKVVPKVPVVAAAPVPAQIMTAKKVFIANAGGDFDPEIWSGGPARAYNEFYASMKSWGRYELVGSPADADLVMELSFTATTSVASYTLSFRDSRQSILQFRLVLLDPRTHICAWGLNKGIPLAMMKENRDKDFDQLLAGLVEDLKALTTPPAEGGSGR